MKYSKEFKLECVRKYMEGVYIEAPPGFKRHDDFMHQVRKWVRFYDSLGEKGLEHGRPTLDVYQRLELIQRVENGESYRSVALSAGIDHGLLIKWHKIYRESGIDGLQSLKKGRKPKGPDMSKDDKGRQLTKSEKEELILLRKQNEYLKAENAYLKKLRALIVQKKAESSLKAKRQESSKDSAKKDTD